MHFMVLKEKTWAEVDDTLKKSVKALMAFHKYPVLNESAPLVKRVKVRQYIYEYAATLTLWNPHV